MPFSRGYLRGISSGLAARTHEGTFLAGVSVLTAEQPGEAVYVLLVGSVKVRTIRPDGTEVILIVLGTTSRSSC